MQVTKRQGLSSPTKISEMKKEVMAIEIDEDPWYSGMLSTFFTSPTEERDMSEGSHFDAKANSRNSNQYRGEGEESRDGVEDDLSTGDSLGSLGKGLGDDMKSLPSVNDDFLPGDTESLSSLDNLSLQKDEIISSALEKLRASIKKDSVESVVDKKIKNLDAEKIIADGDVDMPHLKNKMFPNTSGRSSEVNENQKPPSSLLEARRHILVSELRQALGGLGRFHTRCADITAALADLYDESQEYEEAIRLHKDAVSIYCVKLGDDNETTLQAKIRLGEVQENAKNFDDAISTYFYVMSMAKGVLGEKDPKVADIMVKMAVTLRKQEKYDLSIRLLKRALKSFREVLDDSHPKVSSTVDAIATLYLIVGDFTKATVILEEVVKLKAATIGAESKEVAGSLTQLASCYECTEDYDEAMKTLKKAYKIYSDADGETGELSLETLERVALVYQVSKQYKKAAIAYLGVLRGRKRVFGESHPTVADTYFHLGVSLRESGQNDKASKCMQQALNIYVGEGKDMHDVEMIAEVLHELAIIHKSKQDWVEATKTLKQELSVRKKLKKADDTAMARSLYHLGTIELECKNFAKALAYCNEALSIHERARQTSDVAYGEILYTTGLVFQCMRKKQRSHDTFEKAACIFLENGYNDDHPHLVTAVASMKKYGHKCKCKEAKCSSIPCQAVLRG